MRGSPNSRTDPCPGTGTLVAARKDKRSLPFGRGDRQCPRCQRWVPINYDGSLRWHKAEVKR
jgi:endogenous inhibitor of DNA gyrase (YacG/DUF329 family)